MPTIVPTIPTTKLPDTGVTTPALSYRHDDRLPRMREKDTRTRLPSKASPPSPPPSPPDNSPTTSPKSSPHEAEPAAAPTGKSKTPSHSQHARPTKIRRSSSKLRGRRAILLGQLSIMDGISPEEAKTKYRKLTNSHLERTVSDSTPAASESAVQPTPPAPPPAPSVASPQHEVVRLMLAPSYRGNYGTGCSTHRAPSQPPFATLRTPPPPLRHATPPLQRPPARPTKGSPVACMTPQPNVQNMACAWNHAASAPKTAAAEPLMAAILPVLAECCPHGASPYAPASSVQEEHAFPMASPHGHAAPNQLPPGWRHDLY